jgi:hypothetical protein
MYAVDTKTKTYTFRSRVRAEALATKVGTTVRYVVPVPRAARCVCGRPEDDHESFDCYRDDRIVRGTWQVRKYVE